MKLRILLLLLLLGVGTSLFAVDLNSLSAIGPVVSSVKSVKAITFSCADGSQVQITLLAPDLIRVRTAFQKPIPQRNHSWAIAKTEWTTPEWNVRDDADAVVISTTEVVIQVKRSPLIISFQDKKTGRVLNQDQRPMMFDAKGAAVAVAKKLGFDEHFYGLGEKAARLDKRRGKFEMWNSDTPGYVEGRDPIYQSIPFYIGLDSGVAYGLFFDNSYRTYFDFGASSQEYATFSADGGEVDYYFFAGPSIKKILGRYADLTGHMPMPPKWALGNQQSRWSYYPDSQAEEVVRQYRKHDLPLDVLHLDIHYMNGYRVFTWDPQRFPSPKNFTDKLLQQGVKVVTIVDPGVKYQPPAAGAKDAESHPELAPQDKSYYVFNEGLAKNYFQKRADNSLYVGKVWPGESVFTDFTLPQARSWWGDLHRAYTDNGVSGIWNDMNEPADFVDQTGKAQADVVSYDEGENSRHAKNRNVFALLMDRATREGLERLQPDKRPYIITRAAYAGIQRYSTMWTGDNTSTWEAMALTIPMFTSLGLSGEPFVGGDIGGFIGRADGQLLTRWYEAGFLAPFCRNHAQIDSYDHEPWRFGTYYEDIIRKYLKLRYRLLPFLYTALEEAHRTGVPVLRPLMLNYQDDTNTLNIDDEFMVGSDLLLAPILKADATSRMLYLPPGAWFDFWTGEKLKGGVMARVDVPLEKVPMYVRAGSVIPMGEEMNYVGEKPGSPLTLAIYPDEKGAASSNLYEDDDISPAYLQGVFRRRTVNVSSLPGGYTIRLAATEGSYRTQDRSLLFTFPLQTPPRSVSVNGKRFDAISRGTPGSGWYKENDRWVVQIRDDGNAQTIEIK